MPPALDLRRVAEWAGVPIDDIQTLNPEFRRWTTPVKKGEYTIKVPQGTADKVRDGLAAAEPSQLNAMQFHTVKRGETLATIAKKLRVNRTDLAEANYLRTTSRVAAGTRLIIPRMPSAALLARASSGELEKAAETIASDVLADTTEETKSPVTPARARTYKVRSGDTLSAIARKTGTTITPTEELEQAADDQPEGRHTAADPVAARRQQPRLKRQKSQNFRHSRSRQAAISAICLRSRFRPSQKSGLF